MPEPVVTPASTVTSATGADSSVGTGTPSAARPTPRDVFDRIRFCGFCRHFYFGAGADVRTCDRCGRTDGT